jgi:hypothetical protein
VRTRNSTNSRTIQDSRYSRERKKAQWVVKTTYGLSPEESEAVCATVKYTGERAKSVIQKTWYSNEESVGRSFHIAELDGVAKHADMKQRLDQLAGNNTAIVTLIKAYAPQARMPGFTLEGDKFRNYASAWRDRWNSVMELFMAGGNYAVSGVPFPAGFTTAVDAEIAAAR